jgi:hypothetical protein
MAKIEIQSGFAPESCRFDIFRPVDTRLKVFAQKDQDNSVEFAVAGVGGAHGRRACRCRGTSIYSKPWSFIGFKITEFLGIIR